MHFLKKKGKENYLMRLERKLWMRLDNADVTAKSQWLKATLHGYIKMEPSGKTEWRVKGNAWYCSCNFL